MQNSGHETYLVVDGGQKPSTHSTSSHLRASQWPGAVQVGQVGIAVGGKHVRGEKASWSMVILCSTCLSLR